MAQQTRNPTGDGTFTGTWTAAPRWSVVDDHPDSGGTDFLTHGTTAGGGNFTFSAFTVPAGSYIQSVQVIYYDQKTASQAASWGARLRVNGTDRAVMDAHNPANGVWTLRTATATTNPATGSAWTVNDVNGTGTNPLQEFGLVATDASPTCRVSSIQLVVNYIEPLAADSGSYSISGTAATLRRGFTIAAASGSYSVTGTAASLEYGRVFSCAAGNYTVSGQNVSLNYWGLGVDIGSYSIIGSTSRNDYGVLALAGSYGLTGTAASLLASPKILVAASGSFVLTGTAAGLRGDFKLIAVGGVLALAGDVATLTYSGGGPSTPPLLATMGFGR